MKVIAEGESVQLAFGWIEITVHRFGELIPLRFRECIEYWIEIIQSCVNLLNQWMTVSRRHADLTLRLTDAAPLIF